MSPVLQTPSWCSILSSLVWAIYCLYRGICGRRTWSDSISSSPAAHAGLLKPWANTDLVSHSHFVALMFSLPAAFPDNFLSMEKLENKKPSNLYRNFTYCPGHPVASSGGLLPNQGRGDGARQLHPLSDPGPWAPSSPRVAAGASATLRAAVCFEIFYYPSVWLNLTTYFYGLEKLFFF